MQCEVGHSYLCRLEWLQATVKAAEWESVPGSSDRDCSGSTSANDSERSADSADIPVLNEHVVQRPGVAAAAWCVERRTGLTSTEGWHGGPPAAGSGDARTRRRL